MNWLKTPLLVFSFAFMTGGCQKSAAIIPVSDPLDSADADFLAGGFVYIGSDDGYLYALDAASGAKKWSFKTGGAITTSPYADVDFFANWTISNSLVVTGSADGVLYALDGFSGTLKWSFKTGGPIKTDPIIANGYAFVESDDGNLYALEKATGSLKWTATTNRGVGPDMVIANDVIYCSSDDGNVYAINISDGTIKWTYKPGTGASSSPAISSNTLRVGSKDSTYYAVNANTGELLWRSIELNRVILNSPVVLDNTLTYAGADDGSLSEMEFIFVDWYTDSHLIGSSPTVVNRVLYLGSGDGMLHASHVGRGGGGGGWGYQAGGPIASSPTVAHDLIFVGCNDNSIYAFSVPEHGVKKWSVHTDGSIHSSPCVMDSLGVVYHPYFSGYQ